MAEVVAAASFLAASASAAASTAVASITASSLASAFITAAVSTTVSIGISFVAASLRNKKSSASSPSDVQTTVRQAVAPRVVIYGKAKVGGVIAFLASKEGSLYRVQVICSHLVDGFEEFWIDDEQVFLDADHQVINTDEDSRFHQIHETTTPYIYYRKGLDNSPYYEELSEVFPEWTVYHKGNGLATLFSIQPAIGEKDVYNVYPNGTNTNFNAVVRGKKINGTYSDNAIEILNDYLQYELGMRLPTSLFSTPKAIAGTLASKNIANEIINLKSGGTEPRYRIWGTYTVDERPADVLERMMSACDARIVPTSDGGVYVEPGHWIEPTFTIDDSCVISITSLSRGRDVTETANVINAQFVNPEADFVEGDADPWINETSVALRGEITEEYQFLMSPSHGQTRRLMKIKAHEADPKWKGTFTCNLKAMAVYGDKFVRINYPALGINNETFKIQNFKLNVSDGNILQSVTLEVISFSEEAYEWDYLTEEGTAPIDEDVEVVDEIPIPTGFGATIVTRNISGKEAPFALLEWDASPSLSLKAELKGRQIGASDWQKITVEDDAISAYSFALSDGANYEFEINFISITGRKGDVVNSGTIPAIADTIAPPQITSLAVTGGDDKATIVFLSPNSNRFSGVNIYRNTINNEGTAVLADNVFCAASSSVTLVNKPLAAGTYYFWVTSRNFSGVEKTPKLASGAIIVT